MRVTSRFTGNVIELGLIGQLIIMNSWKICNPFLDALYTEPNLDSSDTYSQLLGA